MQIFPDNELDELKDRKFIIFLGDEFARAKLQRKNLLSVLSSLMKTDPAQQSFFNVAQLFEDQFGRDELVSVLQSRQSGDLRINPDTLQKLVNVPAEVFFTVNYDNLLHTFFSARSNTVTHVLRTRDVEEKLTEGKSHVIHLLGELNDPNSLILTDENYDDLLFNLPTLSNTLSSYLASRIIFFVGFDAGDELLHRIFRSLFRGIERHKRTTYFVSENVNPLGRERLKNMGISHLQLSPEIFINEMSDIFFDPQPKSLRLRKAAVKPAAPYKFLDYFTPEDESVFWGRNYESELLMQLILANKIVVLFGSSGAGKTSLLNAGVSNKIQKEGYETFYVRVFDDPLAKVKNALAKSEEASKWGRNLDLKSFLADFMANDSRIVIFLDQFEEFFLNLGHTYRLEFSRQLSECRDSNIDIRFVISIRGEYFHRLDELALYLPDIYFHRLHLGRLDEAKAEQAILKPAELFGFSFQKDLLDLMLKDLAIGNFDPPQLQIICHTLYSNIVNRKPRVELDDYVELGGMKGILSGYLDRVLDEIGSKLGASSRDCAKSILSTMVTSEQTKSVVSKDRILMDDHVSRYAETMTLDVIDQLLTMRIVRRIPDEPQELFELAHDYLASKIWDWLDKETIDLKYLHSMLSQEVGNWQRFKVLMDSAKLRALDPYRERLSLSQNEVELIFRSSLSQSYEFEYWYSKAKDNALGIDTNGIIAEAFKSPNHLERKSSINCVALAHDTDHLSMLIYALHDSFPQVRSAAIKALESLRSSDAVKILLENLTYEIFINSDTFRMGSENGEADEKPEHEVFLNSFYVDKYPVTNAEYKLFLDDHPNYDCPSNWIRGEIPQGLEDHPVVYISWLDADVYAKWAGKRLLTEAEWEMCASWDSVNKQKYNFPWGETAEPAKCNTSESTRRGTTPIKMFSPGSDSPCGCADMAGNVWEWTSDWFSKTYYQVSPKDNPRGPEKGDYKVIRGGAWNYDLNQARCANRAIYAYPISVKLANVGFRLALDASIARES